METYEFDWEKSLSAPPVVRRKTSLQEIIQRVEEQIDKKNTLSKRFIPLSISAAMLVAAGSIVLIGPHLNLPNIGGVLKGNSATLPSTTNENNDEVKYPPHKKVFVNQDQLTDAEQKQCELLQKIAYAYQEIHTIKGTAIEFEKQNNKGVSTIEFEVREGKYPVSHEKTTYSNGGIYEYTNDNHYLWQQHQNDGQVNQVKTVATRNPEIDSSIPAFVSKASDGNPMYSIPDDPAWSEKGENIVAGLRSLPWIVTDLHLWSISGEDTLLNRKVTIIEGKLPPYMIRNMKTDNGSTYKIWTDNQTGMVLKKQFYNTNGEVVQSFEVKSLEVNTKLDDQLFAIPQEVELQAKEDLILSRVAEDIRITVKIPDGYIEANYNNMVSVISNQKWSAEVKNDLMNSIPKEYFAHLVVPASLPIIFLKPDGSEYILAIKNGNNGENNIFRYKLQANSYVIVDSQKVAGSIIK